MSREEVPGERLRRARTERGLSRAALAAAVGYSESTVRAHENGQNAIGADPAFAYGDALGKSPSWLLFGRDFVSSAATHEISGIRNVELVGIVREGYFSRSLLDLSDTGVVIPIGVPGFELAPLSAYYLRGLGRRSERSFVITTPYEGLNRKRHGDELVVESYQGDLVQRGLWYLGLGSGGSPEGNIYFQGPSQSRRTAQLDISPENGLPPRVVGVIVARFSHLISESFFDAVEGEDEWPRGPSPFG